MRLLLLACLVSGVLADVYLHNPRGSNNRLNERSATRRNANRLFDSQNNNRGGYNTGDATANTANSNMNLQYSMKYYMSGANTADASKLIVEWTNQHGCGGSEDTNPHKLNCDIVVQYMCQNNGTVSRNQQADMSNTGTGKLKKVNWMRDGTNTGTQNYQNPNRNEDANDAAYNNRMTGNENNIQSQRGLHETVEWYDMCQYREANGGLFTADQNLANSRLGYIDASKTRQNPNGQRRGYECPEERDYFPYWEPTLMSQDSFETTFSTTPWIDLAFLTSNKTRCDIIKAGSFNQNAKQRCVYPGPNRKYGKAITEADCTATTGATWVTFHSYLEVLSAADTQAKCATAAAADKRNKITWMALRSDEATMRCVVQAPELDCTDAPWTRVNHNGNSPDSGGNASRYESEIPYFPSGTAKRCAMRLRYNISTDDYDPFNTNSTQNQDIYEGVVSPIEQNPLVDVGASGRPLRLALNTNQYGRTFQDRSHVYELIARTTAMEGKILHNLNVRGKRGNIVQTYPAVEYDFIPNRATISEDDLVHLQWTGSNSHNNGANGGDGQTGDAGEGRGGTDRSNFVETLGESENYPVPYDKSTFWAVAESLTKPTMTSQDLAVNIASSGFYCANTKSDALDCNDATRDPQGSYLRKTNGRAINNLLDNAPASFFGHVLKFKGNTTVSYMCSRNNNFSNRSQKGILWIKPSENKTKKKK